MGDMLRSLQTHYMHLGPIVLVGLIAIAIIAERAWTLFVHFAADSAAFTQKVQQLLMNDDIDGAITWCDANPRCPLASIVKAGLLRAATDPEHTRDAVEIAALDTIPRIQKRLAYLPMIANVATLLGLLGTISGLIGSFKAIATADAATRQSLLAEGISVSMNATAMGLLVAIPAMVAYSVLSNRSNRHLDDIDRVSSKVTDLLNARLYRTIAKSEDMGRGNVLPMPEPKARKLAGAA